MGGVPGTRRRDGSRAGLRRALASARPAEARLPRVRARGGFGFVWIIKVIHLAAPRGEAGRQGVPSEAP
jgi:hypothetical protein